MGARIEAERWELARTAQAAGEARAHVDRYRAALGEDAWRRARLLVSELATNAVRHGTGRIELIIETRPTLLRFCVRDEGAGRPKQRPPGADGGFGLHLVADLSDRWGHGGSGTCVWFEVGRQKVA